MTFVPGQKEWQVMKLSVALPVAKAYAATLSQNLAKYTLQMTMDKGKWCWSRAER